MKMLVHLLAMFLSRYVILLLQSREFVQSHASENLSDFGIYHLSQLFPCLPLAKHQILVYANWSLIP